MDFKPLAPQYDAAMAELIRTTLKAHRLDIPGTAYFDDGLDHLSSCYHGSGSAYYVLVEDDQVIGGIGLAAFAGFPDCCELQKLYLSDTVTGHGIGYRMIAFIEAQARKMGYRNIYLETHTNLQAAIHIYEKTGYMRIERPTSVIHSTMNRFYLKQL